VRAFVGLCNFFRTHIRNFAQMSAPLTRLTRKDSGYTKGEIPEEAMKAFIQLRKALITNPVVDFPRNNRPYYLIVDAATGTESTEGGIGAILAQKDENGNFRVISYGSRQLVKHEKNYSPYLLEMAAAVWGMEFYDEYLRGRRFVVLTDHKPLEKLSHLHTKTLNRLQLAMMEYDFLMQYKKGVDMPADFLSRNVVNQINAIDPFGPDLRALQQSDPHVKFINNFLATGKWDKLVSKSLENKLSYFAKNCFLENGIIWVRFCDNNYPRTAL